MAVPFVAIYAGVVGLVYNLKRWGKLDRDEQAKLSRPDHGSRAGCAWVWLSFLGWIFLIISLDTVERGALWPTLLFLVIGAALPVFIMTADYQSERARERNEGSE